MTFESVRLTHAQAVANHYITNQIYIPTDEDHKNWGSFLILLDYAGAKDGTFNASLVNTLIREYYRNHDADRLTAFEQALVRVNHTLKTAPHADDILASHQLDGCIVLFHAGEIHVTYIGSCLAYLHRQKSLLHLIDPSLDDGPSTGFSVITSGEIQEDDVLTIATAQDQISAFEDDLTFSLGHEPLFEVGRSLARLFKQNQQRTSEVMFVRFNETSETHDQIYCDRPLESSSERMENLQKQAKKHTEFIMSGVHFLAQKALGAKGKKTVTVAEAEPEIPEPTYDEFVADDANADENTVTQLEAMIDESPDATQAPAVIQAEKADLEESSAEGNFAVTNYWDKKHETPTTAASTVESPADEPDVMEDTSEEIDALPLLAPQQRTLPRISFPSFSVSNFLHSRWLYVAIAVIVVGILGYRITTTLTTRSGDPGQTTAERDSLITLAQNELRDSDSAQIQDDTSGAISHILGARTALTKITEKNQNEQSKSLTKQADDSLARLTQSTAIKATDTQNLPEKAQKVVVTPQGSYAFLTNNTIAKLKDKAVTQVVSVPTYTQLVDAVAYDNFSKIAFMIKTANTEKLYSLTVATDAIQELTKSDNKPWPDTTALASFQTNLYFVGPTMFKGTSSNGTTYRLLSYANGESTKAITSLTQNGGLFYGIANNRDLVRIAANTTITPVSLSGVPDAFLPQKFTSVTSNADEALLSFFDTAGQRILVFSTDGAYRKQLTLPSDITANACDINAKTLVCTTSDKKIVTFAL